jgi:molybdopterin-binding protein
VRPDELFSLLGDSNRYRIFDYLLSRDGGTHVGDIARSLKLKEPSTSQHLKVLRDAGLLRRERSGQQVIYSISPSARKIIGDSLGPWGGRAHKRSKNKLSARNRLLGTVVKIEQDAITSSVTLDVSGQTVQAVITTDALKDLGLRVGDPAYAVVKATEVMLMT